MTHIPRPDRLARAGDIRCACVDRTTGAVWMGAAHGALVWQPSTGQWRHVRLKDEAVDACGTGNPGVWLASREWLMQPEAHGAGVRRFRIADATGCGARVDGVAVDRGGTWLVVDGLDGPVPSLLRLPHRPPVFQRFQMRFAPTAGRAQALAGDGERAWAVGPTWMVELEERTVMRPGTTTGILPLQAPPQGDPAPRGLAAARGSERGPGRSPGEMPRSCSPASGEPSATPPSADEKLTSCIARLSPARWLRAHRRGLVGRNEHGLFCMAHGQAPRCPALPGRLDLFATDWLGVDGAMLMASPLGLFVSDARGLAAVAPGEEIVALLDGTPPLAITRDSVYFLDAPALAAAPRVRIDLVTIARELARRSAVDPVAAQRCTVAQVLGQVGRPQDMPVLMGLLSDQAPEVRALACEAVGLLKPVGVETLLGQMMADPATSVQAAASRALRGG